MVGHDHLDEDVAGKESFGADDLLPAPHLHDVLGRNEHLADLILQPVGPARAGCSDSETFFSKPEYVWTMYHCFVLTSVMMPRRSLKMQPRDRHRARGRAPHRYMPNNIDVRMTTNVVACTSFQDGHVTRSTSFFTWARNVRERPHHPSHTFDGLTGRVRRELLQHRRFHALGPRLNAANRRTSSVMTGRPGGTRTPSPRFWRPVLYQLSYWPIRALCHPCRTNHGPLTLLRLSMRCMPAAPSTVLLHLETVGHFPLILRRVVVPAAYSRCTRG